MDKYIKADDLIDRIYPVDPENDGSDGCTIVMQNLKLSSQEIEAILDEIQAADVAPVVHASWEFKRKVYEADECVCSKCGQLLTTRTGERMKYCPNCGAKMDGETHD